MGNKLGIKRKVFVAVVAILQAARHPEVKQTEIHVSYAVFHFMYLCVLAPQNSSMGMHNENHSELIRVTNTTSVTRFCNRRFTVRTLLFGH